MSNGGQITRERQQPAETAAQAHVFTYNETLTQTLPNGNQISYQIGSDTVDVRDARGILKALTNAPSQVSVLRIEGDQEVELNDIQKHELGERLGERGGDFALAGGRVELAGAPEITVIPTEEVAAERQQARWVTIRSNEYEQNVSAENQRSYSSVEIDMNALTDDQKRELGFFRGGQSSLSSQELLAWSGRAENHSVVRNRTRH